MEGAEIEPRLLMESLTSQRMDMTVANHPSGALFFPHLSGKGCWILCQLSRTKRQATDLNCKLVIALVPAGPEQQAQDQSLPAGPNKLQARDRSGPCRAPTEAE